MALKDKIKILTGLITFIYFAIPVIQYHLYTSIEDRFNISFHGNMIQTSTNIRFYEKSQKRLFVGCAYEPNKRQASSVKLRQQFLRKHISKTKIKSTHRIKIQSRFTKKVNKNFVCQIALAIFEKAYKQNPCTRSHLASEEYL